MVKGRLVTMAVGAGWGAGLQEEEDHLAEGDRGREDARLLRRRRKRRRRKRSLGGQTGESLRGAEGVQRL